ncbi:MAG TPA: thiamine-phosphate kinase [Propionibacteriaceae bacterium]|nr:thiamine-phosphate kinase [Propionibacteriaceae bacterium]
MDAGTVGSLGEFGTIARIVAGLPDAPAVSVGPGDDAAVFLVNGSSVSSVDVLVEGVHFRRDWVPADMLGRRAVAVAAADIEAMGAYQGAVLVGLTVPPDLPVPWIDDLAKGIRLECEAAGAALVGGDLTRGRDVVISVTVMGETRGGLPVLRSGAEPGDVVAFRGRLGWSAAGLTVLSRGFRSPRVLVEAYQLPQVPYGAGADARRAGATAMIDVSDGLLADLGHIAADSQVGIDLDSARFEIPDPLHAVAAATGADPLRFILTGGEDHALAATFPLGKVPPEWHVIGVVTDGEPGVLVDGQPYSGIPGWDHFRR